MKELLFRVWNGAKYEYDIMVGKFGVFYVNPINSGIDATDSASLSPFNTRFINDVVVEQFTGLHDATKWEDLTNAERDEWIKSGHTEEDWKGRRIFEGDILCANTGIKWENGNFIAYPQYAKVVYNPQKARFQISGKLGESHKALEQVVNKYNAVVIGNIHDNPELLKEKV